MKSRDNDERYRRFGRRLPQHTQPSHLYNHARDIKVTLDLSEESRAYPILISSVLPFRRCRRRSRAQRRTRSTNPTQKSAPSMYISFIVLATTATLLSLFRDSARTPRKVERRPRESRSGARVRARARYLLEITLYAIMRAVMRLRN